MKYTEWTRKFPGFAIRPMDRNQTHWRLTKGASVVDYWPSTDRWRDLSTGLQGFGSKQLTKHVTSRQPLAEQPE